jgi:hypothetical protein
MVRSFREQHDHQVFQRNDANAELNELGVRQIRDVGLRFGESFLLLRAVGSRASLIIPPRKRFQAQF